MLRWAVAVEMTSLIGWLVTNRNESWDGENEHLLDVIIDAIRSQNVFGHLYEWGIRVVDGFEVIGHEGQK
jgi:hypothetical protein